MNIRHYEVIEEANIFLKEAYNMELGIPIEFNSRIKKVLGRFMFNTIKGVRTPLKIQLSEELVRFYSREKIIDVLKHELTHYALYVQGKDHEDGDALFESQLDKYGISSSRKINMMGPYYKYHCKECGTVYKRKRKLQAVISCSCTLGNNLIYDGQFEENEGISATKIK
jgi:SprT-like protein